MDIKDIKIKEYKNIFEYIVYKNRYTKNDIDEIIKEYKNYENDKKDKCIHTIKRLDTNIFICNDCNKKWCCDTCKSKIKHDLYSSSFMKINKQTSIYHCQECKNNIKETIIMLSKL